MVTEEIIVKSIHPAAEKALAIAEDLFYELEILYGKGRIENFVEENYIFLSFFIIELENEIAACVNLIKRIKILPK